MTLLCQSLRYVPSYSFLFLLACALCWASCQPTDDPPINIDQYPILFKYQKLDFQPSKSYVLTATAFQELPAGTYSVEPYLEEELDIESWGFEIEKVELLDNNSLRLYFFPALGIIPADTVVAYTKVGSDGIEVGAGLGTPYRFRWDKTNQILHYDLQTLQFAHRDASTGETEYSAFEISGIKDNGNVSMLIEEQRTIWDLQPSDTVLVNHSSWSYSEQ